MTEKTTGLALPLLIYFVMAVPLEFLVSFLSIHRLMYADWLLLLNLGPLVQAVVVLLVLVTVRWMFARSKRESDGTEASPHKGVLIVLGIGFGLLTAWGWWKLFLHVTLASGMQDYILGLLPYSYGYYPGTLSSHIGFGRAFAVFAAFYIGITGGELVSRWSPERRRLHWDLTGTSRSELAWNLWVSWVVLYRLSCLMLASRGLFSGGGSGGGGWEGMLLLAAPHLATALTCIPVSAWLANRVPATKKSAIVGSVGASFLITLLAGMLLLPTGWPGILLIASSIVFLNAPGLVWGWFAGELRWSFVEIARSTSAGDDGGEVKIRSL